MLRPIKHPRPGLRLCPFIASTGSSGAFTSQAASFSSLAGVSTAAVQPVLDRPYNQSALSVAQITTNVADGGYVSFEAGTGNTHDNTQAHYMVSRNNSGSQDAGTIHGLYCGWDTVETAAFASQARGGFDVKTTMTGARLMAFRVDGTGAASLLEGSSVASLTDNGTGDYTITYNTAFANDNVIVLTSLGQNVDASLTVESSDAASVNITTFEGTPSAFDCNFDVVVIGQDTVSSDLTSAGTTLRGTQPGMRMLLCEVTETGGTPTIALGGADMSIVDNGVGDYTFTWTDAFKRAPVVVGIGDNVRRFTHRGAGTTTCRVEIKDAAHGAEDAGCSFLVVGFDEDTEY